ncbi:hypothetical protein COU61_04790 [Candidatus Pacearchaeota archaeon CG10_big_fil_rev_8_21_14_0_10_35_13]|nr:MAG: hypothetical protein COU61_04790 [Candidatus Pacearchaeota archaeon CG10_big_fil_rev_8_21_14_0_10_35_13]
MPNIPKGPMITNRKSPQEVFEDARNDIRSKFRLELTLIEQVALRCYARRCLEEQKGCENPDFAFPSATTETVSRFMSDYYRTPTIDQEFINFCEDIGLEKVRRYLRRTQEETHSP